MADSISTPAGQQPLQTEVQASGNEQVEETPKVASDTIPITGDDTTTAKEAPPLKVGEKREREGDETAPDLAVVGISPELAEQPKDQEQGAVEQEPGKESKKPRLDSTLESTTGPGMEETAGSESQIGSKVPEAPARRVGKRGRGRGRKGAQGGEGAQARRTSSRKTKKSAAAAQSSEPAVKGDANVGDNKQEGTQQVTIGGGEVPAEGVPGENTEIVDL